MSALSIPIFERALRWKAILRSALSLRMTVMNIHYFV